MRECGNAVPPEFAQKGHETLNKRGLTTDKREAASFNKSNTLDARWIGGFLNFNLEVCFP